MFDVAAACLAGLIICSGPVPEPVVTPPPPVEAGMPAWWVELDARLKEIDEAFGVVNPYHYDSAPGSPWRPSRRRLYITGTLGSGVLSLDRPLGTQPIIIDLEGYE